MTIVGSFVASGKAVGALCHGPGLPADAVRGRTVNSFKLIRPDIENAGGHWVDQNVAVDLGIIASRSPHDLSTFVAQIIE